MALYPVTPKTKQERIEAREAFRAEWVEKRKEELWDKQDYEDDFLGYLEFLVHGFETQVVTAKFAGTEYFSKEDNAKYGNLNMGQLVQLFVAQIIQKPEKEILKQVPEFLWRWALEDNAQEDFEAIIKKECGC